jgi:hypothetical protein
MLGNSNEYGSKFTHQPMQDIANFCRTMNMSTATLLKGSADLTMTTGVQPVVINSEHDPSLAKTSTVAPDTDLVLTIWVTGSSYTAAASVNFVVDDNGNKQWYACIADHVASAANKPGQPDHINTSWRTYWTESSNRAIQAGLDEVSSTYSRYYLILQRKTTGIVTSVIAGDVLLDTPAVAAGPQIPQFDPELFVAIALILLNSGTDPNIWGSTDDNGVVTITQWIGPCFPTGKGISDTIQGNTASTIA